MGKRGALFFAICFLLLLSLTFSGCSGTPEASAGRIMPPEIQTQPLAGKWKILRTLGSNKEVAGQSVPEMKNSIQFGNGAVSIDGQVWSDLSYKIKRVDAADYLAAKYIPESDVPDLDSGRAEVLTVYAAGNYLGEFMETDSGSMLFLTQNEALLLKKISDQADPMSAEYGSEGAGQTAATNNKGSSGVLLGLRLPADQGYLYRTLWIAADQDEIHPLLSADDLFFPRTSGFWELKVKNDPAGGNFLTARNTASRSPNQQDMKKESVDTKQQDLSVSVIDYIGNDYVAIEKSLDGVSRLQVLPVDNLTSSAEVKISDLLGKNGIDAYLTARAEESAQLKASGATLTDAQDPSDSFGLIRKNGHWLLVGRINYRVNGSVSIKDFELKSIPPGNLIFYDSLALSWHNIRDRVPDAQDAFTSPGRDIALVKTKNKLTVYPIGAEDLNEDPLAELDLPEGTTVIMAEWATGSYVDSWEESFLAYGAKTLPGNSVHRR